MGMLTSQADITVLTLPTFVPSITPLKSEVLTCREFRSPSPMRPSLALRDIPRPNARCVLCMKSWRRSRIGSIYLGRTELVHTIRMGSVPKWTVILEMVPEDKGMVADYLVGTFSLEY